MGILVTGASGFLGGRLAEVLAARGEVVRVLARAGSALDYLAGLPIEVTRCGLDDDGRLDEALRGVTHIYHCAGCATDWAPWSVYYQANVEGTRNLLRAAARAPGLQRFLHVSTTDVYGYPRVPCDETHPPVDTGLPYNRSKCLGERCVWEAANSGLPVTVVRPATLYGPRSKTFGSDIAKLIRQRLMALIDGGRAPGGFCYIDNAVDGIVDAATARDAAGQAYNLADGTGATWKSYVDAIADGLNLPRPWIDMPAPVAFALANVMEAPHRWLRIPGRPLLTRHAVYLLCRDQEYPIEKAKREFRFAPKISYEEGMARMIEWLKRC
jgi:nucleoside-diphosphate-sugar epimerase